MLCKEPALCVHKGMNLLFVYTKILHNIIVNYIARGNHSYRARGTICNGDQNEIKGSTCQFVLDQAIKKHFKEAIKWLIEE